MSSIDLSGVGYASFFILELCIVSFVFLVFLIFSLVGKYYKKYKLLFYTILSSIFCIIGTVALVFLSVDKHVPLIIGVRIFSILIAIIPLIVMYWIHLCSLHKYRDYWILAIVTGLPVLWFLWLLGTY